MKRWMKIVPHAGIVMSGMMLVFYVIDRFNHNMGFMSNEFHKFLALLMSIVLIVESVILILISRGRGSRRR